MQRGSVLPLVLFLICLLVLSAAGFIYFRFLSSKTPDNDTQTTVASPTANSEDQVMRDSLLGLKFEIPIKYSVKKETEEEYFKRAYGNIRKNFGSYVLYSPAEFAEAFYIISDSENNLDKATVTVWVFKNPEGLDAKEFYDKFWYYPFVWGDFTQAKSEISPANTELINGREVLSGVVGYRDGKPKYIYLPLMDKELMMQIQFKNEDLIAKEIVQSFRFE